MDTKPFLPSRLFEIEDQQSAKSLAQIYEDEYQTAAAGGKKRDARDEKLSKDHEEIESLWGDICYKLDALSSAHFVPKQVSCLYASCAMLMFVTSRMPRSRRLPTLQRRRWRLRCHQ